MGSRTEIISLMSLPHAGRSGIRVPGERCPAFAGERNHLVAERRPDGRLAAHLVRNIAVPERRARRRAHALPVETHREHHGRGVALLDLELVGIRDVPDVWPLYSGAELEARASQVEAIGFVDVEPEVHGAAREADAPHDDLAQLYVGIEEVGRKPRAREGAGEGDGS